jgi:DNA mismatch repair ATPase MutS
MAFPSMLFKDSIEEENLEVPDFFHDLNIDQIVDAIVAGYEEYDLKPFLYISLNNIDAIHYRHEIMRDLENEFLFGRINLFAKKMRAVHRYLDKAEKLHYKSQKERWFLDAVDIYCGALNDLWHDLSSAHMKSRGFLAFREYVTNYIESSMFTSLLKETKKLKADLATVKYCLHIKGKSIEVRKYESEIDYSADVEETFNKFQQQAGKDYTEKFSEWVEMNHVEAGILDLVAQLYPDIFLNLDEFYLKNGSYLDAGIASFDREIQFYLAYLKFTAKFKQAGLKFCYPQMAHANKDIYNYEGFDLALAHKLIEENSTVVCNDFYLQGRERIFVVSGPNQGGKTTFARTFGQLHYLASLGYPVPGREARLFLFDRLFTHFEKEENLKNLRGKLQDDLVRIHNIFNQATANSIIILNEIFTSTTLQDAIFLSEKIMKKIIELDLLCVWVTFIDELASFSEQTVSMVSTVNPENSALRTYKILRKPADGLAYAMSIVEKYRLTYDCIKERIKS